MKRKKLKVLAMISLLLPAVTGAQEMTEWDMLLAGADAGGMMVTQGKGKLVFESTRVDSTSELALARDHAHLSTREPEVMTVILNHEKVDVQVSFDGRKANFHERAFRVTPSGRRYRHNWRFAYNGEKLDLLRLDGLGQAGLVVPMGDINKEYPSARVNRYDPRHNGMTVMGTPVGDFLRGTFKGKAVEGLSITGEEELDGVICKVVSGSILSTGEKITVWIAPSQMHLPKQVELVSGQERIVLKNVHSDHGNGIWFPETINRYEYVMRSSGNYEIYSTDVIVVQDFKLNVSVPDNEFEIAFPYGLLVRDNRTGERIMAK